MAFQLQLDVKDQILIVTFCGELDHHAAAEARQPMEAFLSEGRFRHVILVLNRLDFIDSSGIGVILGRYKWLAARGGKLVICGMNAHVRKILDVSGIFKLIPAVNSVPDAMSLLEVFV